MYIIYDPKRNKKRKNTFETVLFLLRFGANNVYDNCV